MPAAVRWLVISLVVLAGIGVTKRLLAADPQPYTVILKPTGDSALDAALQGSSTLISLRKSAPVAGFALTERARQDADRFETALRSFGYYKATVTTTIGGHKLDDPALPTIIDACAGEPAAGGRGIVRSRSTLRAGRGDHLHQGAARYSGPPGAEARSAGDGGGGAGGARPFAGRASGGRLSAGQGSHAGRHPASGPEPAGCGFPAGLRSQGRHRPDQPQRTEGHERVLRPETPPDPPGREVQPAGDRKGAAGPCLDRRFLGRPRGTGDGAGRPRPIADRFRLHRTAVARGGRRVSPTRPIWASISTPPGTTAICSATRNN